LQALLQLLAALLHVFQQVPPLQFRGHCQGSTAGQGIAAKGAGVITRFEDSSFVCHRQCADGEATA
jgi:hypothetical protein